MKKSKSTFTQDSFNKMLSRRQFVGQTLGSIGALMALKYTAVAKIADAFGATVTDGPGKQWCINIVENAPSGWDMWFWLHASNPDWTQYTDDYNRNNRRYSGGGLGRTFDGWPTGAGAEFLASGFNLLDHMVLWQGIKSTGNHGDIEQSLKGSSAPYAEKIGRIVANYLVPRDPTLLDHVGIPGILSSPNRLASAPVMTPLASQADWQFLTTESSTGLPTSQSAIVDDTVKKLSGSDILAGLTRASSKAIYNSNLSAFASSVELSKTNYADGKEFMLLWKQYILSMYDAFYFLNRHNEMKTWIRTAMSNGSANFYCEGTQTSPFFICGEIEGMAGIMDRNVNSTMSDAQFNSDPIISRIRNGDWGGAVQSEIFSKAWRFALTEFLVKHNLTKVVDLSVSGSDSHGSVGYGLYSSTFLMGGVKKLVENLSNTPVPGLSGVSLLDRTLVNCHSDFVRTADFQNDGGWGTNHGPGITIPMFGHGGTPGVHGAIALGSGCSLFSGSLTAGAGNPVAVDSSGRPSSSGTFAERGHVLPTIAGIFNATVPLDQVTEYNAVPGVVNRFKKVA